MRYAILFFVYCIFISCTSIKDLQPNNEETFIILETELADIYISKNSILNISKRLLKKNNDEIFLTGINFLNMISTNLKIKPNKYNDFNEFCLYDVICRCLKKKPKTKLFILNRNNQWVKYNIERTPTGLLWRFDSGEEFYYIMFCIIEYDKPLP